MVIIKQDVYSNIVDCIRNYGGLAVECEEELTKRFPDVPLDTLRSILSKQGQNSLKHLHYKFSNRAHQLLDEYYRRVINDKCLLEMAIEMNYPPLGICRLILNEKFSKAEVKEMLRDPELIPDPLLSANVFTCIFNDVQDGVVIDMIRYTIGEEYEVKLKMMAKKAGLTFYDEGDLRRDGFDKTPDLLLAIQCLYKDNVVNWIESKASFGDVDTHGKYLTDQLNCYENRFGNGIVIYWFGFHEEILATKPKYLTILDCFPEAEHLITFNKLDSESI